MGFPLFKATNSFFLSSGMEIVVVDKSPERLSLIDNEKIQTSAALSGHSDIIFLGIRPQDLPNLVNEGLSAHIVVSMMAGVTVNAINDVFPMAKVVRIIPNTPCEFGVGITPIYAPGLDLLDQNTATMMAALSQAGSVLPLESEEMIDWATGVSAGGPAYVMCIADAMINASISMGFSPAQARALVAETLAGSATLLMNTDKTPEQLANEVMTPNGTTERGVKALRENKISDIFSEALRAAGSRAKELSSIKMEAVLRHSSPVIKETHIHEFYVGCGEVIQLPEEEGVFLPSPASQFFWEALYQHKLNSLPDGAKVLDLGCGSGFIALALGLNGFSNVVATDVNQKHVDYAKRQYWSHLSTKPQAIFRQSDLFERIAEDYFDLVAFNCPGWATPTTKYADKLSKVSGTQYYSMFDGDQIAAMSIRQGLPRLTLGGSLILGLNSISNIKSVLSSGLNEIDGNVGIKSLAKAEFPLLLYNDMWRSNRELILDQLYEWRKAGVSYFREEGDDIFWTYEVVELEVGPTK